MRPVATDGVVWSACLSVGPFVTTVSHINTAETIEMLFET